MGIVIRFPAKERAEPASKTNVESTQPAAVVILPVIRIERYYDEPAGDAEPEAGNSQRRRRRRPASRS